MWRFHAVVRSTYEVVRQQQCPCNHRFDCVAVIVTMCQETHNLSGSLWSPPPTSQAQPPPPSKEPREEQDGFWFLSRPSRGRCRGTRQRGKPSRTTQPEPSNTTTSPFTFSHVAPCQHHPTPLKSEEPDNRRPKDEPFDSSRRTENAPRCSGLVFRVVKAKHLCCDTRRRELG